MHSSGPGISGGGRVWSARLVILAGLLFLGAALLRPGDAQAEDPDDPVVLKRRLDTAQAELTSLKGELADLKGRLALVEQRLGLAPFAPRSVTAGGGMRLDLGAASQSVLVDANGAAPRKSKLAAAFKGVPGGVVAIWATWCKPCTTDEELARLREVQRALRRDGLGFVSLAIDSVDKVRGDPRAPKWLYPLWQGDDAHLDIVPKSLIDAQGVKLPMFFVVGAEGQVSYYRLGALDDRAQAELLTAATLLPR